MSRIQHGLIFLAVTAAGCGEVTSTPDGGSPGDAALQLSERELDFGPVTIGELSAERTAVVRNVGDVAIAAIGVSVAGDAAADFVVDDTACTAAALAPAAECVLVLRSSPADTGPRAATVAVVGDGGTRADLAVVATGVVQGALAITPHPHDFGPVAIGERATQTFTVTNSGGSVLESASVSVGDDSTFIVTDSTCDAGLAAGATCTVDVAFEPAVGGEATTSLTVFSGVDAAAATILGTGTGTVTIDRAGNGDGVVTGSAGIDCGSVCSTSVAAAETTLIATAGAGSIFETWSRADCGTSATCTIALDGAEVTLAATFRRVRTLAVTRAGGGTGTVSSSPAGILCGDDCSETYLEGVTVTLTAAAASGSVFDRWTGCSTTAGATCTTTMSADRTVTATFKPRHTLTVQRTLPAGTAGTVTSAPAGISCGNDCSEAYVEGTSVTLTAVAGTHTGFVRWNNGCTGTQPTCTVTMSAARTVQATFEPRFTLEVTLDEADGVLGQVRINPPDSQCSAGTCTLSYDASTTVTLSASASSGDCDRFDGWGGDCSGTDTTCTLAVNRDRDVVARFRAIPGCTPN